MKYQVEICETSARLVEIEAESPEHAIEKITDRYYNEGIVLDANDFQDVEFTLQ